MPTKKSTTSKGRESQLRKQAQWQRRVAAQGGTGAVVSATPQGVEDDGLDASPVGMGTDAKVAIPRSGGNARAAGSMPPSRVKSPVQAGIQKRAGVSSAKGSARLRMAANQMSIDDEMAYVRSDIRRLIILTAVCMAVLIALAFVLR